MVQLVLEIVAYYMSSKQRARACSVSKYIHNVIIRVSSQNPIYKKYESYMAPCMRCEYARNPIFAIKSGAHTCGLYLAGQIISDWLSHEELFKDYHTFVKVAPNCRLMHAARGDLTVFKLVAKYHNDYSAAATIASVCDNIPVLRYILQKHTISPCVRKYVLSDVGIRFVWNDNTPMVKFMLGLGIITKNHLFDRAIRSTHCMTPEMKSVLTSKKIARHSWGV